MANIFVEIDGALLKAGAFLLSLGAKAVEIFQGEKKVAPAAAEAAVKLFTDVENFISLAAPAVGASGLNFPADSAAYTAFLTLVADAKAFVSVAEQVLKAAEA